MISLTHLSPLVGFIPFSGTYPVYRGKENVFCVRSLTPPQAAGNAFAVQLKAFLKYSPEGKVLHIPQMEENEKQQVKNQ